MMIIRLIVREDDDVISEENFTKFVNNAEAWMSLDMNRINNSDSEYSTLDSSFLKNDSFVKWPTQPDPYQSRSELSLTNLCPNFSIV